MARKADLSASVLARILNLARARGDDYQTLLGLYALERFLHRVGRDPAREQFVLKGAMLLRVWTEQPYRMTRDLDLLRRGDGAISAIQADVRRICRVDVEPDGVAFEPKGLSVEPIRAEDDYVGTRIVLPARCGSARLRLQIDIGVGDSVWPPPEMCDYPPLLEFPPARILMYPREAVIGEKLEAMLVHGPRNSRIKDFFDLHHLASRFEFDRATLVESVRRTLAARSTPIPSATPFGLTDEYWLDPTRPAQLRAFMRRAGGADRAAPDTAFVDMLRAFLLPVLGDVRGSRAEPGTWSPGGPWRRN